MLTPEEVKALRAKVGEDPVLERLLSKCLAITDDNPIADFYFEFVGMISSLSEDMKGLRDADLLYSGNMFTAKDERFDRVMKLMVSSDKIFDGLRKGRDILAPGAVDKKKKKKTTQVFA